MTFARSSSIGTALRRDAVVAEIANADCPTVELSTVPVLSDENLVIGLIDIDLIEQQYAKLVQAFANGRRETRSLHAIACKAVPLRPILRLYAQLGAGCEVASEGELELAVATGFPPENIVFDSPAKTQSQLRRALALGVVINIDNFAELTRIDALRAELGDTDRASTFGMRVNPQTGAGTIEALSTASPNAKFGVGLADEGAREAIIAAFLERPWLTQLHVHSGSQGVALLHAARGIRAVVDLALEINRLTERIGRGQQVSRIDIGGGLPVNFEGEDAVPTFAEYRAVLERVVPELFEFDIVTEFGRALAAKAGTVLTRVEYAKAMGERRVAITHAGVQVATRTAYAPEDWPLRILAYDASGQPIASRALVSHDVAGPACFSGDLLASDRELPELHSGDLIAIPDTGAYYFSSPYSYNLLPRIPIYGYRDGRIQESESSHPGRSESAFDYLVVHKGETVTDVINNVGPRELEPYVNWGTQDVRVPMVADGKGR
ncbi:diaminopimelate decarboxylase [Microbacterium esteraromaticum]|uniref:Diaminopimelate decarboxylase n=1 Tax=Microbacterium esteraromaticum TaxID=57043 RepID=A0A939DV41_9MICO|nr:diaminopimelate decarboxylase [Microbacterium esteraromaticum]MBN8204857.1 diaminopimelate decarboxylase [Microbacterium esteraromaticum]MBN8415011.1 diaminopimelate decarboxylase [Microbacterium esteraromaticum]